MEPIYRIYYGKYPDLLINEIPNEHIADVDGLRFSIEPGKPAEPKIDNVSFTLKNLDHQGNEIYPDSWFDSESLSQASGAVAPLQLFFRVEMPDYGQKGFTGVVKKKSYGKWRETVTVTIEDPLSLIKGSDMYMLKPYKFDDVPLFAMDDTINEPNLWDTGYDLEGNALTDEYLMFKVLKSGKKNSWSDVEFDHDYPVHRNLHQIMHDNPPDYGSTLLNEDYAGDIIEETESVRSVYVQIEDNTILTRVYEYVSSQIRVLARDKDGVPTETETWAELNILVTHANNGNIQTESGDTILERGRFFGDDQGNDLSIGDTCTVTIYDHNNGSENDILIYEPAGFNEGDAYNYVNGYPAVVRTGSDDYDIANNLYGLFDVLTETIEALQTGLYARYYDGSTVDLFDLSMVSRNNRYAFRSDIMLYGWLGNDPEDIVVNLAMQLNCYLYFNESGKIVFHPRLWHEDYLPAQLPPGTFEVKLEDIEPIGPYRDDYGFDSYRIEYADRIPINNVSADKSTIKYVGSDGVRNRPALRSSDLKLDNYRTDDLGVPTMNFAFDAPVFRYSPDDPNFSGVSGEAESLQDFIPTPEQQAQNFAKSWQYPVSLWPVKVSLTDYPDVGIGKYFWVTRNGTNEVYFIRDITYKQNWSAHIEAQKVGTWNG